MDYENIWKQIIVGVGKSYVCFSEGTCVIFNEPQNDIIHSAKELLAEWGPVALGTPSADFEVLESDAFEGYVVACHNPNILTYVSPKSEPISDVIVGMEGRSRRDEDSRKLAIVHIERHVGRTS